MLANNNHTPQDAKPTAPRTNTRKSLRLAKEFIKAQGGVVSTEPLKVDDDGPLTLDKLKELRRQAGENGDVAQLNQLRDLIDVMEDRVTQEETNKHGYAATHLDSTDFAVRQPTAAPLPTADEMEAAQHEAYSGQRGGDAIQMELLATDTTPHTDIEAVMRSKKTIHEAAQTVKNRVGLSTVAKIDTTCQVCGGRIARGWGALFTPSGLIHARADVCERQVASDFHAAKYDNKTTPEFMAVLQQLSFDNYDDSLATVDSDWPANNVTPFTDVMGQYTPDGTRCHLFVWTLGQWEYVCAENSFLAAWYWASCMYNIDKYRITRYADMHDQPQPAPTTEPDDTAPYAGKTVIAIGKQAPQAVEIDWTTPVIAEVKAWLASRKAQVDSVEKGEHKDHKQISGNYATQLNIQDFIAGYRKLGGPKRYPQIIDELTAANPKSVRILHRNTPHTLKAMYDTVEAMYKAQLATATKKAQAVKAATALGDNQCSCRRLPCRCGVAQDAA